MLFWNKKLYCRILHFSLRIVKFLQLYGHRQITESHKYCLVYIFLYFLHLTYLIILCIFQSLSLTLIWLEIGIASSPTVPMYIYYNINKNISTLFARCRHMLIHQIWGMHIKENLYKIKMQNLPSKFYLLSSLTFIISVL